MKGRLVSRGRAWAADAWIIVAEEDVPRGLELVIIRGIGWHGSSELPSFPESCRGGDSL